jgi:hypothetical protein
VIVHLFPSPDFLLKLAALANLMRLSLTKGARDPVRCCVAGNPVREPVVIWFPLSLLLLDAKLLLLLFLAGYGWHHLGKTLT